MAQSQDSIEDWMDSHEWPWQIGTRLHNIFIKLNIQTLGQLLGMDRRELLRVKNMGKKCLKVLDAVLAKDGLRMDRALKTTLGVFPVVPNQPAPVATLRDQFAMAAPMGLRRLGSERFAEDAAARYRWADAMLEARKSHIPEPGHPAGGE